MKFSFEILVLKTLKLDVANSEISLLLSEMSEKIQEFSMSPKTYYPLKIKFLWRFHAIITLLHDCDVNTKWYILIFIFKVMAI